MDILTIYLYRYAISDVVLGGYDLEALSGQAPACDDVMRVTQSNMFQPSVTDRSAWTVF